MLRWTVWSWGGQEWAQQDASAALSPGDPHSSWSKGSSKTIATAPPAGASEPMRGSSATPPAAGCASAAALLALAACCLVPGTWAAGASKSDAELLLTFKAGFSNGGTLLASWVAGTDPCSWPPITCNNESRVIEM